VRTKLIVSLSGLALVTAGIVGQKLRRTRRPPGNNQYQRLQLALDWRMAQRIVAYHRQHEPFLAALSVLQKQAAEDGDQARLQLLSQLEDSFHSLVRMNPLSQLLQAEPGIAAELDQAVQRVRECAGQ
jgi:hypothetical protein